MRCTRGAGTCARRHTPGIRSGWRSAPMASSSYEAIPDFGLLYDSVPLYAARKDIGFYVAEATATRGAVLELGCGTGRILLPIARAGRTVAGKRPRANRNQSAPGSPFMKGTRATS